MTAPKLEVVAVNKIVKQFSFWSFKVNWVGTSVTDSSEKERAKQIVVWTIKSTKECTPDFSCTEGPIDATLLHVVSKPNEQKAKTKLQNQWSQLGDG